MLKKLGFFLFVAASALSASLASANIPTDCDQCLVEYQACLAYGTRPSICSRNLGLCNRQC